ncbi:MAG TPA: ATP-binding protein [Planctomycetota bacterium]|nr:ATP-binding protein [Planctomycetota bacterium]
MVRRFLLAYLALLVVALAVFGVLAARATRSRVLSEISGRLQAEVALVAALVRSGPAPAPLQAMLREMGREADVRLTVIGPDGTVAADSHADPSYMENHNARPEVRAAREEGRGTNVRYSDTVRHDMMYLAVLLEAGRKDGVVIRAALPLTRIREEVDALYAGIAAAFGAVGLGGGLVMILLARWVTGPLRAIRSVAQAIVQGDYTRRAPLTEGDEVGSVSGAINQMAEELERRLERLKAEGAKLEAALSSLTDGVLALDGAGRIVHYNAAAASLLSLAPGSERLLVWEVVRHPRMETWTAEALKKGAPVRHALEMGTHDLVLNFSPLQGSEGCVVVARDVTEEKRYENLRKEFVANVSHELRTPLSVIRGYVETLRDEGWKDGENAPKFLEAIDKNVERLSLLVGDLLELSRLESGSQIVHPRKMDLREILERVAEDFRVLASKKRQSLGVEAPASVSCVLDPDLVERALRNLVDNAIKYTPEGGTITLRSALEEETVLFTVADTGIGIPESDLPRIFERFYRVDKSRSRELGGTGLGLAIVKHVAQLMGGTVTVQSQAGKGSVFRLRFPRVG